MEITGPRFVGCRDGVRWAARAAEEANEPRVRAIANNRNEDMTTKKSSTTKDKLLRSNEKDAIRCESYKS